jgi:very-short-patch-repair endonuclease
MTIRAPEGPRSGKRREPPAASANSRLVIGPNIRAGSAVPTSPCKGEVDREAVGRGSTSLKQFSRAPGMTSRARKLRGNLTEAEKKLWRALRRDQLLGLSFRRQHPIGTYVLDFYCPALALAIEIDRGQHTYAANRSSDERRSRWLTKKGIRVIRFWNNEVLQNLQGVLSEITRTADLGHREQTPSLPLPLSAGLSHVDSAADADGDLPPPERGRVGVGVTAAITLISPPRAASWTF